ncbi:MAG TPA: hypothetical protein VKY33_00665, partial [Flavobacterium sp.]|nr:hypothetical protein [Flavobacterium sp.]
KNELAQHVFDYCKQKNITVIYTSHTPEEILMFSDLVIVLKEGKLMENDTPQNIYELPATEYIARLTGEVNLIPVRYFGVQNDEVLLIRPHQLILSEEGILGKVKKSYYKGFAYLITVQTDGFSFSIFHNQPVSKDSLIRFSIKNK